MELAVLQKDMVTGYESERQSKKRGYFFFDFRSKKSSDR